MSGFVSHDKARALTAGVISAAMLALPSMAADSVPDFAPNDSVGWVAYGTDFIPPPSGPGPVASDPAHPFIPDPVEYRRSQPDRKDDRPSTFRVADLSNSILQSWAREELRKRNELILSGKPGYNRQVSCWPLGVPAYLLYPIIPIYFVKTPKEVVMISNEDHMVRHIYLGVPHSARVKPSWSGESVGHYEGDTLVVDTIGLNDKTYIDNYRTPHSDKLHVVERYHLIDAGKTLEVNLHVEDPGAFTTPWDAIQRFTRTEIHPLEENHCAENNANYFNYDLDPIPVATKPDF
jgi:hypothetical protein